MTGPPAASAGGMHTVSATLLEGLRQDPSLGFDIRAIDSGGGVGPKGWLRFPPALQQVVTDDYDILHLHLATDGSTIRKAIMGEAALRRGVPYVIHLHGSHYDTYFAGLGARQRAAVVRFFDNAAAVVVLGQNWYDLVVGEIGTDPARVHIVHNGVTEVEPSATPIQDRPDPYIVFVGWVDRRKGADVLLSAVTDLFQRPGYEAWRMVFLGPVMEPDLATIAAQSPVAERIEQRGTTFGAEKDAVIREAAVFCLPSRAENLPMAILEAMSAGLPCVCTDVGAVGEVVHDGVNGRLIAPADVAALTEALDSAMADAGRRAEWGAAGRRIWADGFSDDRMVTGMTSVWRRVLEDAR
ncbi:glycosyltransferase family 4 protein [Actinomycetota bacterium]